HQALVVVREIACAAAIAGLVNLSQRVEPVGDGGVWQVSVGAVALVVVGKGGHLLHGRVPGVGNGEKRAAVAITVTGDNAVGVGGGDHLPERIEAGVTPVTEPIFGGGPIQSGVNVGDSRAVRVSHPSHAREVV